MTISIGKTSADINTKEKALERIKFNYENYYKHGNLPEKVFELEHLMKEFSITDEEVNEAIGEKDWLGDKGGIDPSIDDKNKALERIKELHTILDATEDGEKAFDYFLEIKKLKRVFKVTDREEDKSLGIKTIDTKLEALARIKVIKEEYYDKGNLPEKVFEADRLMDEFKITDQEVNKFIGIDNWLDSGRNENKSTEGFKIK